MIRLERMESGGEAVFGGPAVSVGRDPGCHLHLDDEGVSRLHARLQVEGDAWTIRDLGSTNGTTVGGRRLRRRARRLKVGDVLRFGGGSAWRVVALEGISAGGPGATLRRGRAPASGARLRLYWETPDRGVIEVEHPEGRRVLRAGQPFVLLDSLAEAEGRWVENGELARRLWGRRASVMSRSALDKVVHEARSLLAEGGVEGTAIEAERGRKRLTVEVVERVPWR